MLLSCNPLKFKEISVIRVIRLNSLLKEKR